MRRLLLSRLGTGLLVLIAVSAIAFAMLRLSGDLAAEYAGEGASAEQIERVRIELGLDRALPLQYLGWMSGLVRGELGQSLYTQQSVASMIGEGMGVTFRLATYSLVLALLVSVPLGMLAAYRRKTCIDALALSLVAVGQGIPSFWLALLLAALFGVQLGWLPVSGSASPEHYVLPVITMAIAVAPVLLRVIRASMIETLEAEFMRTAHTKGLGTARILFVHALPNAALPLLALVSVQFGQLLAGSVVVEQVFSLDGVGRLALQSVERLDFPVVQAIVLCLAVTFVTLTLLSDILGALIDPRLRRRS